MFITSDILHTIYTAIPLLFYYYKCKEENATNSSRYDEYVLIFFSAYILLTFAFIIVVRILIIEKNELKVWIKFIKLCFFSILFWLVIKEYALMDIFKLGVPNCLLIMSFLWNILSKKTVTEFWFTFLIKLILDILTHITLITNYHWDWLSIGNFIKYFSYFSSYIFTQNSRNIIESDIANHLSIFIQIIMIWILLLQKKYGSLFFLPSWFRTKIYGNMERDITKTSHTDIERCWMFWTNPIWKIELCYTKNFDKLSKEANSNIFYETKWGLVYHRKWFYESLKSYPNCPHWDIKIPIDSWDD